MNTDTPEDIAFRESERNRARFNELVRDMDKDDRKKTNWHRQYDKRKAI